MIFYIFFVELIAYLAVGGDLFGIFYSYLIVFFLGDLSCRELIIIAVGEAVPGKIHHPAVMFTAAASEPDIVGNDAKFALRLFSHLKPPQKRIQGKELTGLDKIDDADVYCNGKHDAGGAQDHADDRDDLMTGALGDPVSNDSDDDADDGDEDCDDIGKRYERGKDTDDTYDQRNDRHVLSLPSAFCSLIIAQKRNKKAMILFDHRLVSMWNGKILYLERALTCLVKRDFLRAAALG